MQSKLSKCLLLLTIIYSLYSLQGIYRLLNPPACTSPCLNSVLLSNPNLTFKIVINRKTYALTIRDHSSPSNKLLSIDLPRDRNQSIKATISLEVDGVETDRQQHSLTFIQQPKQKLLQSEGNNSLPLAHWKGVVHLHLLEPISLSPQSPLSPRAQGPAHYQPVMYINDLKFMSDDGYPVNASSLPLNVHYSPISQGLLLLHLEMLATVDALRHYGVKEAAFDELKSLMNANVYLLFATFVVSSLHLILEMLAIKSEVDFWKKTESCEGISVSAVRWKFVSSIVIFFYLLDQKSSVIILMPLGAGILLEFWKVMRSSRASLHFGWPFLRFDDPTSAELESWNVEMKCVRLMSPIIYPVLICTAVYTLLYVPQKSWYSWVLSTMANGVYSFGFVFMLPQLYINHKLKSVDKLPWQALIYKGVNAFIDDLFVFVVKMPTAHRLARFRDDIVFVIYLVQRFMYPVDQSRTHVKVE